MTEEINWLPASYLISALLLFDSGTAVTLQCHHLCLIPLKAEMGLNFAGFDNAWVTNVCVYIVYVIFYTTYHMRYLSCAEITWSSDVRGIQ